MRKTWVPWVAAEPAGPSAVSASCVRVGMLLPVDSRIGAFRNLKIQPAAKTSENVPRR
jgi:hypothetical protein